MTENVNQGGRSLDELRGEMSDVTGQMAALLRRRTEIAVQIGQAKQELGRTQVRDLAREELVLGHMVADNEAMGGPVSAEQMRRFGGLLIDIACEAQVARTNLTMGATPEELPELPLGDLPAVGQEYEP